ncbi:MAG: TonB-dependent receptor, partial [Pararheinheimera sp.]|nr:TonB-dependent receptor [Rheinheimera sp.]
LQTSAGLIDQPGYSVFDAFARWQSSQIEGLSLTFALRNLSDKWYRDQATLPDFNHIPDYEGLAGLPEPGRDARVELAWWF